jgi:hypothetical protein
MRENGIVQHPLAPAGAVLYSKYLKVPDSLIQKDKKNMR